MVLVTSGTMSNGITFALQGLQKVKREKSTESMFQEIITENFPNSGKKTDVQ